MFLISHQCRFTDVPPKESFNDSALIVRDKNPENPDFPLAIEILQDMWDPTNLLSKKLVNKGLHIIVSNCKGAHHTLQ